MLETLSLLNRRPRDGGGHMVGKSHWQRLRLAVGAWRRAGFAAWTTAVGIALSLVTEVVSAVNAITTQQSVAMAVPAVLSTVGGLAGRIVPDARIAWRRGFRHGREAALTSPACLIRADDAGSKLDEIRLAKVATYPAARYCVVCGRGYS
jgi:hypothetical protein